MSDASAEAERLISALRTRGYQVVDVPLGLLVNRVSVQRPALILCDADAPGAVESVERIHRDVPGGHRVDVVFVRERGSQSAPDLTSIIEREGSGSFDRPVDDMALTRKVEALIGPPTRHEPRPRLAAGGRAPILVAATRRPFRYDQKPGASLAPEAAPASQPPKSTTWVAPSSRHPSVPPSSPGSSPMSSPEPSSNVPNSLRREDQPPPMSVAPGTQQLPQARLSPELEMLLGRAEQKVTQSRASVAPPSDRLSPEAELEAILPNDVLAALDEPLDLDDSDESDAGPSTHGGDERGSRGTGTSGTKTGHGSGGSKAPGQITGGDLPVTGVEHLPAAAAGQPAPSGEPAAPAEPASHGEQVRTEPPPSRETEPPKTPPAVPSRAAITNPGFSEPPPRSDGDLRGTAAGNPSDVPPPSLPMPAAATAPPPQQQASTTPPRALPSEPHQPPADAVAPSPPAAPALRNSVPAFTLPTTLRAGEAMRCLALAVRSRYTGAVAFEAPDGMRRVVFRDGDFVTAATSVDNESLVACLIERGNLPADASVKLGRKLPLFGRHAGAALIAHGYLQQDELWPVLRSHAEWLIGRIARLERAETGVEPEVPPRLATEPAVFGGATGAEVLVELARRVSSPEASTARLGGTSIRLRQGPSHTLLGECALPAAEADLVRSLDGETLAEALERAKSPDFSTTVLALVELGILETAGVSAQARRQAAPAAAKREPDRLDHEALRSRIAARRALVDEGDYFALLGVGRGATSYDVRRAYSELREELDPTRILTPATADLRDDVDAILLVIDEAFEILQDDLRRERYRRALEAAPG
ncbi:MAG TPA: hypothetical protein VHB79_31700 [Polyangiaceae bacterium]|nr:hypothetical protein [Polyangiaceae bacterium]